MSRRGLWLAVAVLFVTVAGLWTYRLSGAPPHATAIGGPFALVDGAGHTRTDTEFRGRFMLIYFGYTHCPDVCPTTLAAVGDAMAALGTDAARVQPVFITIDPARDTPDIVGQYAAQFSPDLLGLTGTTDAIASVARAYRVYYAQRRTPGRDSEYTLDHSSILYLVGTDGRFLTPIDASLDGADLAARLRDAFRGVA